jgi:hypothetical protein
MHAQIKFDYDFMNGVYQEVFEVEAVFLSVTGLKILAVCLVMFNWYHRFFKGTSSFEQKERAPITPYDIFKGIFLVAAISFYDTFLIGTDQVMKGIENQYKGFEATYKGIPFDVPEIEETTDSDWTSSFQEFANESLFMLEHPFFFMANALKGILSFVDILVYGVFLAERYFFLGLLRILGAFALACYAIPKLEKWFWQWFGLYISIYLLVIPYFLINAFTNTIYDRSVQQVGVGTEMVGAIRSMSGGTGLGADMFGGLTTFIILAFCIWIKLKLYKKSHQIIFKIFS